MRPGKINSVAQSLTGILRTKGKAMSQYTIHFDLSVVANEIGEDALEKIPAILNDMEQQMVKHNWQVANKKNDLSTTYRFWYTDADVNRAAEMHLAKNAKGLRGLPLRLVAVISPHLAEVSLQMAQHMARAGARKAMDREIEILLEGLADLPGVTATKGSEVLSSYTTKQSPTV